MRAKYDLFNVVGLVIAGLLFAAVLNNGLNVSQHVFVLLFIFALGVDIGIGSLINLTNRGLLHGPTKAMITGYCLSVALLPFGIWGLLLLKQEMRRLPRRRRGQHHHENTPLSHF